MKPNRLLKIDIATNINKVFLPPYPIPNEKTKPTVSILNDSIRFKSSGSLILALSKSNFEKFSSSPQCKSLFFLLEIQ